MAKMIIIDNDGSTLEYHNFVGAGVRKAEGGKTQVDHFIEDEEIEVNTGILMLLGAARAIGELSSIIVPEERQS